MEKFLSNLDVLVTISKRTYVGQLICIPKPESWLGFNGGHIERVLSGRIVGIVIPMTYTGFDGNPRDSIDPPQKDR